MSRDKTTSPLLPNYDGKIRIYERFLSQQLNFAAAR
jgi:hypothetical protein